ncbi:MAG: cell division protein FtsK [Phycisphaeraceae bacterium]|nr:MAG: cell division protein FtsK [Phycisphaeraceae bacterium]
MEDATLSVRARGVLRRLVPMVAERASRAAEVEKQRREGLAAAERESRAASQALASEAGSRRASASSRREAGLAEVASGRESAVGKARAQAAAEIDAFVEKTDRYAAKAQQDLEESQWLAETLVESGAGKAKAEHERAMKVLRERGLEIESVRTAASVLLRQHKHGTLPVGGVGGGVGGGEADTAGAVSVEERLASAMTRCRSGLETLKARVRPTATRPSSVIIAGFAAGVAGAVGAGLTRGGGEVVTRSLVGGGVGVAAALLLALSARLVLRMRVPASAQGLADALTSATAALRDAEAEADAARDRVLGEAQGRRDEELRRGRERFERAKAHVEDRRRVREPALRSEHGAVIAGLEERFAREAAEIESEHTRAMEAVASWEAERAAEIAATRAGAVERVEGAYAGASAALAGWWDEGVAWVREESSAVRGRVDALCPGWEDLASREGRGWSGGGGVPEVVRFGEVVVDPAAIAGEGGTPAGDGGLGVLRLPAVLDFYGVGSLLVRSGAEGRSASVGLLRAVMLRLLTTFPPGKVKFTIVDPVGLGQNFAGFMHLADHDESLVSDKIWTDARHIEAKLTDLTEHMENVIQKYLRNEFATIQAYNERAGEVAEPFRFLVMADFPTNLTEASAKRLASVIASGPRCGVYTLIATDPRVRPAAWVPMSDLERSSVVVTHKDGGFVWEDEDFRGWRLEAETPPVEEVLTRIVRGVGSAAKEAGTVRVPYEVVEPGEGREWTGDASGELRVPLGRAGATKLQHLTLGRGTGQHALIAGRTGSGKSTLLHAIITTTALWYGPGEVEMYLVDFKKGVEFKGYASGALPHARVIAVESEREFGLSVLRRLDAELSRRGQVFRELGVQDLAGYRRAGAPSGVIPRTLLIVDEFQEFFVEDDKVAQESMLLLDRLVRQGRAFGMHVILGSQTIGGAYSLARSTLGQMAVRIALQCSEADSYLIMSEDNPAARLLARPGEAIYNDQSGMIEGNSPFQIVWLSDEVRDERLGRMRALAAAKGTPGFPPAIVFEGNVPSRIETNHPLGMLLSGSVGPPASPVLWLGEPISIKDPTGVVLRRQSGGNVLVVGQQESATLGVVAASVVSFRATTGGRGRVVVLDGGSADGEATRDLVDLGAAMDAEVRGVREAEAAVGSMYDELERRRVGGGGGGGSGGDEPVLAVVYGLQRFRALRKSEMDFSFGAEDGGAAESTDKKFAALLKEGPGVGIFTLVRVDTSTNLERAMDRRMLKEFDHRVLFQMSANDSANLIDSTAAGSLGQHRGLLYSEETGVVEKFRPYAAPSPGWIAAAARGLAART